MPFDLDVKRLEAVQHFVPTPFTDDGRQIVPEMLANRVGETASAGIRVLFPAADSDEFHSLAADSHS